MIDYIITIVAICLIVLAFLFFCLAWHRLGEKWGYRVAARWERQKEKQLRERPVSAHFDDGYQKEKHISVEGGWRG